MAAYVGPRSTSYSSQSTPYQPYVDQSKADGSKLSELFTGDTLLELCNSSWERSPSTKKDVQPYLRGCKWSPDGTCCLCVVNHDGFHIMELPRDMYEGIPSQDRRITSLPGAVHVKESGTIYDFCWYPNMNSHYPETCCWISTKINSPIQMWDAYDGSLRCSYRGFNALDEMEPAVSVTFINNAQRIVGGYKNCLRTFDVERPGREFLEHKIKSPASCLATHGNLLAVGSWNANINLLSILENGTNRSICNMHAHTGGITHLKFTPDGTKLVSGARKDNSLCVWDIRYPRRPLNILKRSVSTNQRIYFDISPCGRYLVSGGTDGIIRVWDDKISKWTQQFDVNHENQENATFRFQAYRDCCNSISIHPSRPILATGSGQFHFLDPIKVLESECDTRTNDDDVVIEKDQSAVHGSSDEEILVENSDVPLTEVHKTGTVDKIVLETKENICSDDQVMDKEVDKKASDKEAETVLNNTMETDSESPPHKKPRLNDDVSNTDKKINGNDIPVKVDAVGEPISQVTNEGLSVPSKECNLTTIEQPLNNIPKDSTIVPVAEDNNDVQALRKPDPNSPSLNNLNKTEQIIELSESVKSTTNIPDVKQLENPAVSKCTEDSALESDEDNDINENTMKYSSYAENNLTFWWIAKT